VHERQIVEAQLLEAAAKVAVFLDLARDQQLPRRTNGVRACARRTRIGRLSEPCAAARPGRAR
jgi:hypothetical protein